MCNIRVAKRPKVGREGVHTVIESGVVNLAVDIGSCLLGLVPGMWVLFPGASV